MANKAKARVAEDAKVANINEAKDARFISFSLTKCSAIFSEVKDFEENNNQLGLGINLQIRLMCRSTSSVQNWWQQRI